MDRCDTVFLCPSSFDFIFCDQIAANSAASAEALKTFYNLPDSKIGIIHLGINTNDFEPTLK